MTQEPTSFPMGFAGQRQSYAWLVFFVVFVPFVVNEYLHGPNDSLLGTIRLPLRI